MNGTTTKAQAGLKAKLESNPSLGRQVTPLQMIIALGVLGVVIAIVAIAMFLPASIKASTDNDPSSVKLRYLAGAIIAYGDEQGGLPALKDAAALHDLVASSPGADKGGQGPVWETPGTKQAYLPNPSLGGKKMSDFKAAKIVAVYEPGDDAMPSRKAGMLDGHVETIGKQDWAAYKAASGIP